MTTLDRMHDRLRWRCRRGMLELDLVLNAFLDRHLDELDASRIEALKRILELSDPELLDLVMGRFEPEGADEQVLVALMRKHRADSTV